MRPEKLRHALVTFNKGGEKHYHYVPYRPMDGVTVHDHIDMYCGAKGIKSPVHMVENSMGKKLYERVM